MFQFPDVLIPTEQQAYANAHQPKDSKQERRAAALPGAKQARQALAL